MWYIHGHSFDLSKFKHPVGNDWINNLPKNLDISSIFESYHSKTKSKLHFLTQKYKTTTQNNVDTLYKYDFYNILKCGLKSL
jgi:hypothetical protein